MTQSPLRLSTDRVVLYGAILCALCLVQVRFVVAQGFGDWTAFWAAGATAGTRDLLDPARHAAWQSAHHLLTTVFPYLPGAAWFFVPFKPLTLATGYAVNFIVMALAGTGAAILGARTCGIPRIVTVAMTFAWAPFAAALATGQNSPVALLMTVLAITGVSMGAPVLAGLATGALLYKFPYAVPFMIVLAVRRQYGALGIVLVCAAAWYFVSVAATAGDWMWPAHYVSALRGYFDADARQNAVKAIGIPGLLLRGNVTDGIAIAVGALLLAAAIPLFARMTALEAASFAPLLALAASPHTQPYDLALMLPALWYFATHAREPMRTWVIGAVYVAAPLWLLSGVLRFDVLAILCDLWALIWLLKGYDESTFGTHFDVAHPRDRGKTQTNVH